MNTFKFYLIVLLVGDDLVSPKKESLLDKPLQRTEPFRLQGADFHDFFDRWQM